MIRMMIVSATAVLALTAPAVAQDMALSPGQTLLEVQATGESYASPDMATITGGVVTYAADSRGAAQANAGAMARVVKALRDAGVASRDIQTRNLNLQPQMNYNRTNGGPPEISGYQASNSVTVRVRDIDKAAGLLTTLFEAGANNANGPNFSLSNDDAALAAARSDAVGNARAEAEAYAAAFGMKIVRVLRISERGQQVRYNPVPINAVRRQSAGAPPPPPPPPPPVNTPVEAGEMQQQATIWVDYALEPR